MKQMKNHNFYDNCMLCPRTCGAQRSKGKTGICGVTETLKVARAALHFWEEPCISGTKGSGAVFFSGCALHCVFCQNEPIAQGTAGKEITPERLVEIFLELQEQGANNINLVTPGQYVPHIIRAVEQARRQGLAVPIVYNTGSYENVDTIKALEGIVDIYLPDFKYMDRFLRQNIPMHQIIRRQQRLQLQRWCVSSPGRCLRGKKKEAKTCQRKPARKL